MRISHRHQPAAQHLTDLPYVETPHELLDRHGRVAGRLISGLWALTLVAALLGGADAPTGDRALVIAALGMTFGVVCGRRRWGRAGLAAQHVLAGSLTLQATAAAVALDGTGTASLGAFVLAAAFAGAIVRPPAAAAAHIALAGAAPILVAGFVGGRADTSLQTVVGLAPFVLAIGGLAAVLANNAVRREAAFRMMSRRDPLTGVGNYRRLHERLAETVSRNPERFALLTMDVDSFKAVNDRYGHLEGDRLLREVGRALVDNVRGKDIVARQGGDEFAVLAPETDEQGAQLLAARIEQALQAIRVENADAVRASIGIAVYPRDGRTPEELLARSDDALRRTKETRRGPIVLV
ncbi:diguanylate cyclase domain-containing protein [Paraconexibacter sp.]|uniref:GGDEF domain-containing protein n=1 Tax=Paraconexibacter sp. TaxID=2949640 RepID=UPI0035669D48